MIDPRADLLAEIARTPSPTRSEQRGQLLVMGAVAALVSLGIFFARGGVRIAPRPVSLVTTTAVGWGLIALVATFFAVTQGRSSLGRPARDLWLVVLLTPVALFAFKCTVSQLDPAMAIWWPSRPGLRCLLLSVLTAGFPFAVALRALRQRTLAHSTLAGAATGVGIAAVAGVFVDLWCPVGHPLHVLIGHVLPIGVLALAGAAFARRA